MVWCKEIPILSPWEVVGNSNDECVKTNLLVKSMKLNRKFQRGEVKLFSGRMAIHLFGVRFHV